MDKNTLNHPVSILDKSKHPMEFLMKQKSEHTSLPKSGDIVEGEILEKKGSRLFVDLGAKGTGIIFGREFTEANDIIKGLNVGDRLTAKVVEPDNEESYVELSLKEAGREKNWQDMRERMDSGQPLQLKVMEANRGGLILEYLGVQGFLPASQLSQEHYPRVEGGDKEKIFEELKKLIGQELSVAIIDTNPADGKLIFSEKSKETEVIRQKLAGYKVGDTVEGEIAGIVSFGAFIKFGDGLEGLVHISEIDWQLIMNPADVLKVSEKVKAKIIGIEGDKVSLSLKALKEDPWSKVDDKYKKGDTIKGTVVKFNPFGAFVKLDENIQGLAHISEFGSEAKMKEMLGLNQVHEFKVLSVDAKEHRLALGLLRPADEPASQPASVSAGEPASERTNKPDNEPIAESVKDATIAESPAPIQDE